jgi:hypothetical protein
VQARAATSVAEETAAQEVSATRFATELMIHLKMRLARGPDDPGDDDGAGIGLASDRGPLGAVDASENGVAMGAIRR